MQALFTGGDVCAGVGPRSFTLLLQCGEEEKVWGGEEPATCSYRATMTTPAACTTRELDRVSHTQSHSHTNTHTQGHTHTHTHTHARARTHASPTRVVVGSLFVCSFDGECISCLPAPTTEGAGRLAVSKLFS